MEKKLNSELTEKLEEVTKRYEQENRKLKKNLDDAYEQLRKQQDDVLKPMLERTVILERSEQAMRKILNKNERDLRSLYAVLRLPKMCHLFYQAESKKRSAE